MDKVRKYVIKEKGEQIFFLVCFILLVVIDSIDNTSLRYSELSWMETMYVLRNALYFLMLAGVGWNFLRRLLILRKQHQLTASRLGEFVGVALLILLGGASFLGSRDSTLLCFFVIAVGVNGLSSRRLARLYFVLKSIALVSTILCWRIGLLPTLRYLDDTVGHYNTYGFGHRNVLGANLVVLCLLWCYLRYQKLKVQDLIIWAAIAFVSYRFILSRTALIMILISVIFMYGMQRLEKRIFNFPHLGRLVTGIFIGFILLSLISAIFYSPDSEFWQFLNRIFTKRISFAHQCLVDHGLSLFGKDLPFVSSMEAQVSDSRRLILDNFFLRVILYYGILPGAAFFYLYYRGIRYALSRKKGALLCTLVVFLIFGMSESYMLDAFYQFPLILVCCSPKFWEGWNRPLFPILKAKPAIQAQSKGQDSIKKNFAYNVTYQLLLIVLPVITTPYIARIFGADGIGTYANSEFSTVVYMPAAVLFDGPYSNSTSRIRLLWKEVAASTGYQIWRLEEDGTWKIVKTLGDRDNKLVDNQGKTTAYSNTGLEAGKTYTYKMRAFAIVEEGKKVFGAYSDEYKVAVMPEAVTLEGKKAAKAGIANLLWNKANGAAGYQIWMSEAKDGTYKVAKSVTDPSVTSYDVRGLSAGKTYYFKARAYVEVDGKKTFGAYSNVVSVPMN